MSDPRIGGTYLTLLNTVANLGNQWPGTVVLATKGALERTPGAPDSFYCVAGGSVLVGILFIVAMRGRILELQERPPSSWAVPVDPPAGTGRTRYGPVKRPPRRAVKLTPLEAALASTDGSG